MTETDTATVLVDVAAKHRRDFPAIVAARPDHCTGCDWTGTNHAHHVAEQQAAALAVEQNAEPPTSAREWTVVTDDDGDHHTLCPCGARDEIAEVDVACSWNTLNLADDGQSATAMPGSGDREGVGWICQACLDTTLNAPAGFEITNWY